MTTVTITKTAPDGFVKDGIKVSTNGLQGGDGGHGGFMNVELNVSAIDLHAYDHNRSIGTDPDEHKIMLTARGDWEICTLVDMAKAIIQAFENQKNLND